MRIIPIYLLIDERFLKEPSTTMILKFVLQAFGDDFSYFRRLFFVCVGSVELMAKTKSNTVFLISSSLQSKQKFFRQHLPAPCISHKQSGRIPHLRKHDCLSI